MLIGAWFAARYAEEWGIPRDDTYRLATWMVLAGIIGSRITWVLTHLDEVDSPLDVIAIWEGGLQFSGGFVFGVIAGYPIYSKWDRLTRWHSLDGYAYGLTIGLAIGRIACYSVGEHFGSETSFFLGTRYEGGDVREGALGDVLLRGRHGVPQHRALRADLPGDPVRVAHMGPLWPQAAASNRHGRWDLLHLVWRVRASPPTQCGSTTNRCSG